MPVVFNTYHDNAPDDTEAEFQCQVCGLKMSEYDLQPEFERYGCGRCPNCNSLVTIDDYNEV